MTAEGAVKAMLVQFAWHEVEGKGSLNEMLAVACCIRNRVVAGWSDGDWIRVIDSAPKAAAHGLLPADAWCKASMGEIPGRGVALDFNNESLMMLMREVEDIYHGVFTDELTEGCKYWLFAGREVRPWFQEKIVRQTEHHPRLAQVGQLMMFE